MVSCSARKKDVHEEHSAIHLDQKEAVKVESKIETDLSIKSNVNESVKQTATSKKKTFTPIDNSKPSSVTDSNGKTTVLNNASLVEEETADSKNIDKVTDATLLDKTKKSDKKQSDINLNLDSKNDSRDMNLDKKGSYGWLWFWILLLVIAAVIVWWVYKKVDVKSYVTRFFKR